MSTRGATLALLALLLQGCADDNPEHRHTFPALGTLIVVEIHDPDADKAERASAAAATYLEQLGREWYAWGDGELARVNAALANGDAAPVSADLEVTIRRALAIRDLSDGYFDPTVGLLVEAWGFNDSSSPPIAPPDEQWLTEWRAGAAERANIVVADGVVRVPGAVKLALGGIAKGTALANATRILRDNGIEIALVDAGGDLQVIGSKANRRWRIGIRDPRSSGVLGVVELRSGEAILSSGDYERYFELDGQRFHHLLDPHTGRPVAHTAGVTVIHDDPELADAAATGLMAAGPARFEALAAQMEIDLALLVTGNGEILTTAGMRSRLDAAEHNAASGERP